MSKIYKDFEDYASSNGNTLTRYKESHADTWNACQISKQQEIDQLKEQLDYYSNKINVQNYIALTKENTHLKARIKELEANDLKSCVYKAHLKIKADRIEWLEARIKELEQYINMTENSPYQSKTNAELEALHSNAIEARDWFTCDLISNEQNRRDTLLRGNQNE